VAIVRVSAPAMATQPAAMATPAAKALNPIIGVSSPHAELDGRQVLDPFLTKCSELVNLCIKTLLHT
jgi:hypothetical protein